MDTDRCQHLAERLHQLLLQRLGMGLDTQRMLNEPLYARDVLLVCAAHPGSELASLAWEYRDAASPPRPAKAPAHRAVNRPAELASQAPSQRAARTPAPRDAQTPVQPPAQARPTAAGRSQRPAAEPADSQPETPPSRSPLSRFSRLSLSRFGASIFGGSLFEGTLFGSAKTDPVTDFGDDSYLSPTPTRGQRRPPRAPGEQAAPRRSRWFWR